MITTRELEDLAVRTALQLSKMKYAECPRVEGAKVYAVGTMSKFTVLFSPRQLPCGGLIAYTAAKFKNNALSCAFYNARDIDEAYRKVIDRVEAIMSRDREAAEKKRLRLAKNATKGTQPCS